MLRIVMLVVSLALLAPKVALAQSEPGHVYQVLHWKAHTESQAAYSQAYWDIVRPVWTEAVRRGRLVSFLELSKNAGDNQDATHMILTEFEDWEAYANFGQALEEASQAVLGRPYAEVSAEEFEPLRDPVRSELYVTPPGGM